MWRRKATRYAWGVVAENELRKLLEPHLPVICRSSRSGGSFDVWAVGHGHTWLFQVKRQGPYKTIYGRRRLLTLLAKLHESVDAPGALVFVAARRNVGGRVRWVFYRRVPLE
jgi:hypothetical protein